MLRMPFPHYSTPLHADLTSRHANKFVTQNFPVLEMSQFHCLLDGRPAPQLSAQNTNTGLRLAHSIVRKARPFLIAKISSSIFQPLFHHLRLRPLFRDF
jgi:hypothetical protein